MGEDGLEEAGVVPPPADVGQGITHENMEDTAGPLSCCTVEMQERGLLRWWRSRHRRLANKTPSSVGAMGDHGDWGGLVEG